MCKGPGAQLGLAERAECARAQLQLAVLEAVKKEVCPKDARN